MFLFLAYSLLFLFPVHYPFSCFCLELLCVLKIFFVFIFVVLGEYEIFAAKICWFRVFPYSICVCVCVCMCVCVCVAAVEGVRVMLCLALICGVIGWILSMIALLIHRPMILFPSAIGFFLQSELNA